MVLTYSGEKDSFDTSKFSKWTQQFLLMIWRKGMSKEETKQEGTIHSLKDPGTWQGCFCVKEVKVVCCTWEAHLRWVKTELASADLGEDCTYETIL